MRTLGWIFKIALFLVLFGFALKNTETVLVRGYLGYQWHLPLVLILLIFFALGTAIGLAAGAAAFLRQQRRIVSLKRQLNASEKTSSLGDGTSVVVKQG